MRGGGYRAQLRRDRGVSRGDLVQLADFDVGRHGSGPFGACSQKPSPVPDDPGGVECIAGDQELQSLPSSNVWAYHDPLAGVVVQEEHLERIAQVVVIELFVADAVKPDG